MKAVRAVIDDTGFTISERGQRAQLCANRLLEWMMVDVENRTVAVAFTQKLIVDLSLCLKHPRKVKLHTLRERMWEKFYKLRSSQNFRDSSVNFLQVTIGFIACPIFYQYVSNRRLSSKMSLKQKQTLHPRRLVL